MGDLVGNDLHDTISGRFRKKGDAKRDPVGTMRITPAHCKAHELETDDLTFSEALEFVKHGMAIQREGWNGEDLFVRIEEPRLDLPYLYMRMPSGFTCPWVPTQTDLMAEDWRAR